MDDRGRRPSSQGVHRSPQPSPHRYHDAQTGLEQPLNQSAFGIEGYNTIQSNNASFGSPGNAQPYMNNFSVDQSTIMGNQYMAHGVDSTFGTEGFMMQANPYAGTFNQDFPLNQYQSNVNPADLNKISSPDMGSQALLSPENHNSPGPQSPTSTNGQFHTPQHSRNVSLDPNSAYNTGEWQGMAFRNPHHRSPSDVSDVSSVQNSPFVPHAELATSHSPLFGAQQDTSTFGLDSFTIGDQAHSQPGSNYVSPRLIPQQEGLGIGGDLMLNQGYIGQEVYGQDQPFQNMGALHNRQTSVVSDIGQADQFEPPTINIEPAPVSRQASFGPGADGVGNSLYPPFNSGRGRNRSKSETISRPMSSRSPSPGPSSLSPGRSPSPGASISRASSPGVSEGRISRDRRASTSVINNNNREYILDLADPTRPNGSAGGNSTRVQKHPATFQCTLCPKRFTRAYNLRSHLRTHTDERPFVCTICGKAFARQHDRKRHEGLHSGEKKFVCKGELNSAPGSTWGCGRRFARADALGRHFRSEAGRVCIKPLLDEEAAERRQRAAMEQQSVLQQHQAVQNMLQPVPQQMNYIDSSTNAGFSLPAALLAQYPALQNLDWNAISAGGVSGDDMDGDLSDVGYDGSDVGGGHLSDSGIPAYGGGQHNNGGW